MLYANVIQCVPTTYCFLLSLVKQGLFQYFIQIQIFKKRKYIKSINIRREQQANRINRKDKTEPVHKIVFRVQRLYKLYRSCVYVVSESKHVY